MYFNIKDNNIDLKSKKSVGQTNEMTKKDWQHVWNGRMDFLVTIIEFLRFLQST